MKKLALSTLLFLSSIAQAIPVKLADAETLNLRLKKEGFGHFATNTNLHETLGDTYQKPFSAILAINSAITIYCQSLSVPEARSMQTMGRYQLVNIILADHDDAQRKAQEILMALENAGFK